MQLDLLDLRTQWNIIKQPSWSDLLDDPDLAGQLLDTLTAVLGNRAETFLQQQGTNAAKELLKSAAAGWTVQFESLFSVQDHEGGSTYFVGGDYSIKQTASPSGGTTRSITINRVRRQTSSSIRDATDAEINAAITAALHDERVTDYGTGITPFESAVFAGMADLAANPQTTNTLRLGTSVLQVAGGIAAVMTPTGLTQAIGTYSIAVGTDEFLAAVTGLMTHQTVRSSREQFVDAGTGSTETTDQILFWTDLGLDGFDAYQTSRAWMKNRKVLTPKNTGAAMILDPSNPESWDAAEQAYERFRQMTKSGSPIGCVESSEHTSITAKNGVFRRLHTPYVTWRQFVVDASYRGLLGRIPCVPSCRKRPQLVTIPLLRIPSISRQVECPRSEYQIASL